MNVVIFYEKSGCATNAKQKAHLRGMGYFVIERDLLNNGFSAEELQRFLDAYPVAQWFNPNAPAVKQGDIDPFALDRETALRLLLVEPILIRRPLMQVGEHRMCGYDEAELTEVLGKLSGTVPDAACSHKDASKESACSKV